jgi:hypothetical protein
MGYGTSFSTGIDYWSLGDSWVKLPALIDPYAILNVQPGVSTRDLKSVFTSRIANQSRQVRAQVTLAHTCLYPVALFIALPEFFKRTTIKSIIINAASDEVSEVLRTLNGL